MKKSLAILALLLLAGSSLSAAQKDPRSMLMKDMRTMLDAMEQIQRGGFYSSSEDMKLGVKKLQGTLGSLETEDVQWILPKDQKHAFAFAQKSAKMLRMYSDDLVVSVDSGRMDDALENYNQLLRQCMSCHIRIRNW
jgi:cytochrome c556